MLVNTKTFPIVALSYRPVYELIIISSQIISSNSTRTVTTSQPNFSLKNPVLLYKLTSEYKHFEDLFLQLDICS